MLSKKRILFVNTPIRWRGSYLPLFPIGLAAVATWANRAGHETDLIDLNLYRHPFRVLADLLAEKKYDVVAIGLRSIVYYGQNQLQHLDAAINLTARISPQSKIICGGSGFSIWARQAMIQNPNIDAGVIGEGEIPFLDLIESELCQPVPGTIIRKDDFLLSGGIRDSWLEPRDEPLISREWPLAPLSNYYFSNMYTKRGCVLRCAHCPVTNLHGNYFRFKEQAQVEEEIEYLRRLGAKRIFITDSFINPNIGLDVNLVDYLTRIETEWGGCLHPNGFSSRWASQLAASNCRFMTITVDSGAQRILNQIGSKVQLTDVEKCLSLLRGFPSDSVIFTFLFGYPGETVADQVKTLKLALRARLQGFNIAVEVLEVFNMTLIRDRINSTSDQPFFIHDWKWRWFPMAIRASVLLRLINQSTEAPAQYSPHPPAPPMTVSGRKD